MKIAVRLIETATADPRAALEDALGLAALCALLGLGFAATSLA